LWQSLAEPSVTGRQGKGQHEIKIADGDVLKALKENEATGSESPHQHFVTKEKPKAGCARRYSFGSAFPAPLGSFGFLFFLSSLGFFRFSSASTSS
jgi:hypothetical protein